MDGGSRSESESEQGGKSVGADAKPCDLPMVTAGGVTLAEVSTKSMMSNLVSNLFFVGEVLDIDGDTGGYNIQAAISTGYIAGKTIRQNG